MSPKYLRINFLWNVFLPLMWYCHHFSLFYNILENENSSEFTSRLARSSKEGRFKYTYLPRGKVSKDSRGKKSCFKCCFFIMGYCHLSSLIIGVQLQRTMYNENNSFLSHVSDLTMLGEHLERDASLAQLKASIYYVSFFNFKPLDLTSQNHIIAGTII